MRVRPAREEPVDARRVEHLMGRHERRSRRFALRYELPYDVDGPADRLLHERGNAERERKPSDVGVSLRRDGDDRARRLDLFDRLANGRVARAVAEARALALERVWRRDGVDREARRAGREG